MPDLIRIACVSNVVIQNGMSYILSVPSDVPQQTIPKT